MYLHYAYDMKLIKEVCVDTDVLCNSFDLRRSVRAILSNEKGEIAIMNNKNFDWFCLPGGTMEAGDEREQTLRRECLEEAGAQIEILDKLGFIIEQRNRQGRIRLNYYFIAKVVGELQEPSREADEIESGMTLEFHSLDKAIEISRNAKPRKQLGEYQQAIDLAALEYYKKKLSVQ